jgi:hypothetical protein
MLTYDSVFKDREGTRPRGHEPRLGYYDTTALLLQPGCSRLLRVAALRCHSTSTTSSQSTSFSLPFRRLARSAFRRQGRPFYSSKPLCQGSSLRERPVGCSAFQGLIGRPRKEDDRVRTQLLNSLNLTSRLCWHCAKSTLPSRAPGPAADGLPPQGGRRLVILASLSRHSLSFDADCLGSCVKGGASAVAQRLDQHAGNCRKSPAPKGTRGRERQLPLSPRGTPRRRQGGRNLLRKTARSTKKNQSSLSSTNQRPRGSRTSVTSAPPASRTR